MKTAVENLSASRVKVSVDLDFSELKPSLDAAYQRIASQVNIPGFRKGHVPARIIDQRFGKAAALDEAVNDAIPSSLAKVVVDNNLVQMSRPEVDVTSLDEETGLSFTAEFDVRPDFELPKFAELKVVVDDPEVTDAAVEEQLDDLRARFGSLKTVERAANDGDIVVVDLRGSHNDVDVPDLSAQGLSYELGSQGMVDGFDDAVRGASADEVRHFVFTPTNGEWAEKAVVVEVTVRQVRERELPKADDTFAQLASEFDTIDELRADLRERLGRMRLMEQAYQARDLAHDALMEAIKVEVPAGAVADEISAHFHDGHGDEAHRDEFEQQARTGIKSRMVLDKIVESEDLQVNDAEMTQWLITEAQRYQMAPDQFADELVKAGQINAAVAEVRRTKALSFVLEQVQVVDKSGRTVDLESVLRGPKSDAEFDSDFDTESDTDNFEANE
ncbi:MAG: trigger factor [Actinobacteria bacterium]|nr:trigger factor [Actinomycetota bacterium]